MASSCKDSLATSLRFNSPIASPLTALKQHLPNKWGGDTVKGKRSFAKLHLGGRNVVNWGKTSKDGNNDEGDRLILIDELGVVRQYDIGRGGGRGNNVELVREEDMLAED
jgi:hypothetical protein